MDFRLTKEQLLVRKMVREFANILSNKTDLPIIFIEENLTSAAASEEIAKNPLKSAISEDFWSE